MNKALEDWAAEKFANAGEAHGFKYGVHRKNKTLWQVRETVTNRLISVHDTRADAAKAAEILEREAPHRCPYTGSICDRCHQESDCYYLARNVK